MSASLPSASVLSGAGGGAIYLARLNHWLAEQRASLRHRAVARRLCLQLRALDDRLLRDIGIDDGDIARLRSGKRFFPSNFRV